MLRVYFLLSVDKSFGNWTFQYFPDEIIIPKLVFILLSCAFTHVPYDTLHNTTESLHITAIVYASVPYFVT